MPSKIECPECGTESPFGTAECPRCRLDFTAGPRNCFNGHHVPDWSPLRCLTCGGPVEVPRTRPIPAPLATAPPPDPGTRLLPPRVESNPGHPRRAFSRGFWRIFRILGLLYVFVIAIGLITAALLPPDNGLAAVVGAFALLGAWSLSVIAVVGVIIHRFQRNTGNDRKIAIGLALGLYLLSLLGRSLGRRHERFANQPYTNDRADKALVQARRKFPGPWNNWDVNGPWIDHWDGK